MKYYIDLGAYNGDSAAEFLNCNTVKHHRETFLPRPDASDYKLILVEPCATALNLQAYTKLPNVEVIEKVAWTYDGDVLFKQVPPPHPETVASCVAEFPLIGGGQTSIVVRKPCFNLSHLIFQLVQKDMLHLVLKMNVESSEYELIPHLLHTGAMSFVDELYIEWHHRGVDMYDKMRIRYSTRIRNSGVQLFENWWR